MAVATLYSTWKQVHPDTGTVHLIVIAVIIKEGEVRKYTLLNLDGSLEATDIDEEKLKRLINKKAFQPWKP